MQCTNPIRLQVTKRGRVNTNGDGLLVPCGKCLACRLKRKAEWAMRLQQELMDWDRSMFLTLTYDNDNLPINNSLVKSDLQNFFKRLRKNLDGRRIRYYACGEYGDITERPHYHMILFGVGNQKEDRDVIQNSWPYCDWSNPAIRRGSFGLVEPDSIRYVAGYITKKLSGDMAQSEYVDKHREPVFVLMSKGIGRNWSIKNKMHIANNGYILCDGVKMAIPRYYIDKLALDVDMLRSNAVKRECEVVEHYTGVYCMRDVAYRHLDSSLVRSLEQGISDAKMQHNRNLTAKYNLYKRKL